MVIKEEKLQPLHLSQAFDKIPDDEGKFDFFNANLAYDTPAFLDPFLLKNSPVETERELFKRFGIFFKEAYTKSLAASHSIENQKKLKKFLSFREPQETYLGYTLESNRGSGLGSDFAESLLNFFLNSSINRLVVEKDIYPGQEFNPAILALIAEGLGYDGISDLTTCLVMDYLIAYTQEQCKIWDIPTSRKPVQQTFNFQEMEWTNGVWAD